MSQDELSKREEDRINRTLNNVGRRPTRPTSWNVPQTQSLNGPLGSMGRSQAAHQAASIKAIQDQIREEERKLQQQSQPAHAQQQPSYHIQSGISSSGEMEDDGVDKGRKMKLEEERLERWMKKGDTRFEEIKTGVAATAPPSFDSRKRASTIDSYGYPEHISAAISASSGSSKLNDLAAKFHDHIFNASKALRQRNAEDVARHSFSVTVSVKALAELLSNDEDIMGAAMTLEVVVASLRNSIDSGEDGQQYFSEIHANLGSLFISTVGAL